MKEKAENCNRGNKGGTLSALGILELGSPSLYGVLLVGHDTEVTGDQGTDQLETLLLTMSGFPLTLQLSPSRWDPLALGAAGGCTGVPHSAHTAAGRGGVTGHL